MTETTSNTFKEIVTKELETLRPYLQAEGGDVEVVGVNDEGVVFVRLSGACSGCPGAAVTLTEGIERFLKQRLPQVQSVATAT